MKVIKIEIPTGYEVDKDKSTFEEIVFKKVDEFSHLPTCVEEIGDRRYFIDDVGGIEDCNDSTPNNLSTKARAKAFLALMQLVELRDAWNEGWQPDWTDSAKKYCIHENDRGLVKATILYFKITLAFKSEKLRDEFSEQFADLIEQARELL